MQPPALDAVFIDLGNTLLGMDLDLLAELTCAAGIQTTPERLARAEAAARPALSRFLAGGRSSEGVSTSTFYVRSILEGLERNGGDLDVVTQKLHAAARGIPTPRLWSRVLPGGPEALIALRAAGLGLVVVSNSNGTAEEGLILAGLRPLVDAVIDSHVVGVEKPDPRIFDHALAAAGSRPERTLHVGDLYAVDVLGAHAAGIRAVLVDPYDDFADVDCERAPDFAAVARSLVPVAGTS